DRLMVRSVTARDEEQVSTTLRLREPRHHQSQRALSVRSTSAQIRVPRRGVGAAHDGPAGARRAQRNIPARYAPRRYEFRGRTRFLWRAVLPLSGGAGTSWERMRPRG